MGLMKITNKIIWGAVVYPTALQFFDEYLQSVDGQDDDEFKLLILNDGVQMDELQRHLCKIKLNYSLIDLEPGETPVVNRIKLLKYAKDLGAELLIIGDCDDVFSENRVRKVKDAYVRNPDASFFYNDLLHMNGSSVTPPMPEKVESVKEISQLNYLGMSNTSINLHAIEDTFIDSLYECDSIIFDWYLHSRLLLKGGMGIKLCDAFTYYRIYDENVAGVRNATRENLRKELQVKKKHYEMLSKYDMLFKDLLDKYSKLDVENIKIPEDDGLHFWWDLISLEV